MTAIANLRSLMERATPGPWIEDGGIRSAHQHPMDSIVEYCPNDPDRALIVAMRNALPKLLAVADLLREAESKGYLKDKVTGDCDRLASRLEAALADMEKP